MSSSGSFLKRLKHACAAGAASSLALGLMTLFVVPTVAGGRLPSSAWAIEASGGAIVVTGDRASAPARYADTHPRRSAERWKSLPDGPAKWKYYPAPIGGLVLMGADPPPAQSTGVPWLHAVLYWSGILHGQFSVAGQPQLRVPPRSSYFELILPLWVPVVGFGTGWLVLHRRDRRLAYRLKHHLCLRCGYSLDTLASGTPCPECGSVQPIA